MQQALIEIGLEFQTEKYEPPGIAVFMFDNATFVKCEKSFYYDTEKLWVKLLLLFQFYCIHYTLNNKHGQ